MEDEKSANRPGELFGKEEDDESIKMSRETFMVNLRSKKKKDQFFKNRQNIQA